MVKQRRAVPKLAFALTRGDLGQRLDLTEVEVIGPLAGPDNRTKQSIAALGLHCWFGGGGMNDALHGNEAWRRPCYRNWRCTYLAALEVAGIEIVCLNRILVFANEVNQLAGVR